MSYEEIVLAQFDEWMKAFEAEKLSQVECNQEYMTTLTRNGCSKTLAMNIVESEEWDY